MAYGCFNILSVSHLNQHKLNTVAIKLDTPKYLRLISLYVQRKKVDMSNTMFVQHLTQRFRWDADNVRFLILGESLFAILNVLLLIVYTIQPTLHNTHQVTVAHFYGFIEIIRSNQGAIYRDTSGPILPTFFSQSWNRFDQQAFPSLVFLKIQRIALTYAVVSANFNKKTVSEIEVGQQL